MCNYFSVFPHSSSSPLSLYLHFLLCTPKPSTTFHHSKVLSRSRYLCFASKNGPLVPQQTGTEAAGHAHQLHQLSNGRAGWPAEICIKGSHLTSRDSFIHSTLVTTINTSRRNSHIKKEETTPDCPATKPYGPGTTPHRSKACCPAASSTATELQLHQPLQPPRIFTQAATHPAVHHCSPLGALFTSQSAAAQCHPPLLDNWTGIHKTPNCTTRTTMNIVMCYTVRVTAG
jgi:hypothetical protein